MRSVLEQAGVCTWAPLPAGGALRQRACGAHSGATGPRNGLLRGHNILARSFQGTLDDADPHQHHADHQEPVHSFVAVPPQAPVPEHPALQPPLGMAWDAGAWTLAGAFLLAARISRTVHEESVSTPRGLREAAARELAAFQLSSATRSGRETVVAQEAAAADTARVSAAAQRAQQEEREERERQAAYSRAAAQQAAQLREERERSRQEYDARQARLEAEMAEREAAERATIAAQRAEAAAQAARAQREAEAAAELEAQERAERAAAELAAAQAAERQAAEERQRLRRSMQTFSYRLDGEVTLQRPPKGTTVMRGPLVQEATLRVATSCGSILGGPGSDLPWTADFAAAAEAGDPTLAVPGLAGCYREAAEGALGALRLQASTGSGGPLGHSGVDPALIEQWVTLGTLRACVAALGVLRPLVEAFVRGGEPAPARFSVKAGIRALPADHPGAASLAVHRAVQALGAQDSEALRASLALLAEEELALAAEDLQSVEDGVFNACFTGQPGRFVGLALAVARVLAMVELVQEGDEDKEAAWKALRGALRCGAQTAASDTLQVPAALLAAALPPEHRLVEALGHMSEANLSPAQKKARLERERALQAAAAAQLLEEDWVDEAAVKATRIAEQQKQVPYAERIWALTNVAGTLAMGGPGETEQARRLAEQAVSLKQEWIGAPRHPCLLPEFLLLVDILSRNLEWERDAAGLAGVILRIVIEVADAYAEAQDPLSGVILLEGAQQRLAEIAGLRNPALKAASRASERLQVQLTPAQLEALVGLRKRVAPRALQRVAGALAEKLGVQGPIVQRSKIEEWARRGVALLGPLT
ncbi:hypothetical protein ACKKBF_B03705 [Auxenochlorella protothecoides x Auxenochlorella symbiontica]